MLATFAKWLGLRATPLDRDLTIDEFVARVQHELMTAPYGRELRTLKRFALRHRDPEFARVFLAKHELYEQQQREFRPPGSLSVCLYFLEKSLGYVLSSRTLAPGAVLTLATLITGLATFFTFDLKEWKVWLGAPTRKPVAAAPASTSAELSAEQLLAALQRPEVRDELRRILPQPPGTQTAAVSSPDFLAQAIERALPKVVAELPATDEERRQLLQLLTAGDFAKSLAERAVRATPSDPPATDGTTRPEDNQK